MLDEIIIILSTFQPLSIANFALCKKNRGLFMAKFSTTVVLSRQNPVDWRSLLQEFPNTVEILLGLVLPYEAKIIKSFFWLAGALLCTGCDGKFNLLHYFRPMNSNSIKLWLFFLFLETGRNLNYLGSNQQNLYCLNI